MPITVYPCDRPVRPSYSRKEIVKRAAFYEKKPFEIIRKKFNGKVLQASFPMPPQDSSKRDLILQAENYNGFVDTAIFAFDDHHHLVIRPDDVWIAILAQFSLYVKANAEQLGHLIVALEDKFELTVTSIGAKDDFGDMTRQMEGLIQENVIDPGLREWIISKFTTTTPNDLIISSIITLSTKQRVFSYRRSKNRGLPAVTLLGEKEDWEKLLEKIEKIKEYGEEATRWHSLLKPVLTGFVTTFNQPEDFKTKLFWQRIASVIRIGCRPSYLTGWIIAFCFFGANGEPLICQIDAFRDCRQLLEDVQYHRLNPNKIPSIYAEVAAGLKDKDDV